MITNLSRSVAALALVAGSGAATVVALDSHHNQHAALPHTSSHASLPLPAEDFLTRPVHPAPKHTPPTETPAEHAAHEAHLAHLARLAAQKHPSDPLTSPAPTSQHVPESGTLSCIGLEALWVAAGGNPAHAKMAASIAMAESGGRQYAMSPTNDVGYWQINSSWGPAMASTDPFANARAAIQISHDGTDWTPWTTYTSGAYQGQC